MTSYRTFNPHHAYLENFVLAAGPVELVRILYRIAIDSVQDARQLLVGKDVMGRGQAISKVSAAIFELTYALDYAKGGEVAYRLRDLYTYMQHRLTAAHRDQSEEALAEVVRLLEILSGALSGGGEPPELDTGAGETVDAGVAGPSGQAPSTRSRGYGRVAAAFSAA